MVLDAVESVALLRTNAMLLKLIAMLWSETWPLLRTSMAVENRIQFYEPRREKRGLLMKSVAFDQRPHFLQQKATLVKHGLRMYLL